MTHNDINLLYLLHANVQKHVTILNKTSLHMAKSCNQDIIPFPIPHEAF